MKTLLTLALCLMASCTAVTPASRSQLVGEWRYADKTKTCHYVFDRDGRFHGEVTFRHKMISKFVGRWSIAGDSLLYDYVSDEFHRIPAGARDRDRLLTIHSDFFTIEAADGSRRTYIRIR